MSFLNAAVKLKAKMSAFELESMTLEEVGEWLKEKGLSEDVVDAFTGEFWLPLATCKKLN